MLTIPQNSFTSKIRTNIDRGVSPTAENFTLECKTLKLFWVNTDCKRLFELMTGEKAFNIDEFPENGRLSTYKKELMVILEAHDDKGIIPFCEKVFQDCIVYLRST